MGIAVGSAGNFAGMVAALILGPTLGAHGQLHRLLVVEAIVAVLPVVWLLWTLPGSRRASATFRSSAAGAR